MNRAAKRLQKKLSKKVSSAKKTPQDLLQQGINFHQSGQLEEAILSYRETLIVQPKNVDALSNLGSALQTQGNVAEAIVCLTKAVQLRPAFADAHYNLGTAFRIQGKADEAIKCFKQAISSNPNFTQAYYNLGGIHKEQGRLDEAVACLRKALTINPDFLAALNNLGHTLTMLGRFDEADCFLKKAVAIKPDFLEALVNLGNNLNFQEKLTEAKTVLKRAIAIKPDFLEAMYNLGSILIDSGEPQEGVEILQQAVSVAPANVDAHLSLGRAHQELCNLEEAVASYQKVITLQPSAIAFNNLAFTLEAICYDVMTAVPHACQIERIVAKIPAVPTADYMPLPQQTILDKKAQIANSAIPDLELAIVKLRVQKLAGEKTLQEHEIIMEKLPTVAHETIANNNFNPTPAITGTTVNKSKGVVAMLGLANAGSGLFHSLLDSHPEISIMPGVYMSGFFGRSVWQQICSEGYDNTSTKFAELYDVVFDARSRRKPPPAHISDQYGEGIGIGVAEGFDKLGKNHDTPLFIDRDRFLANLASILSSQKSVDHGSFFEHVHNAYETTLGHDFQKKKIILHHLHKHDNFSMRNLLKNRPDTRLLTITRNPVQGCEAWAGKTMTDVSINKGYKNYNGATARIAQTLRDINSIEFSTQDSVGVRLEDIKNSPKETMERLSAWLGVEYSTTLHESTIQGLQWWGDPGSILFGKSQTTDHGKDEPIRRKTWSLLGTQDRHILETLFYPFNCRFGYVEPNQRRFEKELQEIRPLLEKPLDFELNLAKDFLPAYKPLEMTERYKAFHAVLLGRWRILDELGTYPDMFKPLP